MIEKVRSVKGRTLVGRLVVLSMLLPWGHGGRCLELLLPGKDYLGI